MSTSSVTATSTTTTKSTKAPRSKAPSKRKPKSTIEAQVHPDVAAIEAQLDTADAIVDALQAQNAQLAAVEPTYPEHVAPDPVAEGIVTLAEQPASAKPPRQSASTWRDLPASPVKGTVKPGCVLHHTLDLLRTNPSTLDAIQAMLDNIQSIGQTKQRHSALKLLRWASNNRGFGFTMDPVTKLITLHV